MNKLNLETIVRINTYDDAVDTLGKYPELLGTVWESSLRELASRMLAAGEYDLCALVSDRLRLTRRAAEVGISTAAHEWTRLDWRWVEHSSLPAEILHIIEEIRSPNEINDEGHFDHDALSSGLDRLRTLADYAQSERFPPKIGIVARVELGRGLGKASRLLSSESYASDAVTALAEAAKMVAPDSIEYALIGLELAEACSWLGKLTGSLHLIFDAAAMAERLVLQIPSDDLCWPVATITASALLVDRYEVGHYIEDLDDAIRSLKLCIDTLEDGYALKLAALAALGSSLELRHERTGEQADIEAAIAIHENVLGQVPEYAKLDILPRLATAAKCLLQHEFSDTTAERLRGIYREVLGQANPESVAYTGYMNNYGNFMLAVYDFSGPPGGDKDRTYLDEATRMLEDVVRRVNPGSPDRPGYLTNLARAYGRASQREPANALLGERAVEAYRDAVIASRGVSVELALDAAVAFGSYAEKRAAWTEASWAWDEAQKSVRNLLGRQRQRGHKELWLQQTQGLAAAYAYTRIMLDDPEGAAMALEFGQAVLHTEALEGKRGAVAEYAERRNAVIAASQDCTLVYIAACVRGGLAVIVRDGKFEKEVLPRLSRANLGPVLAALGSAAGTDYFDSTLADVLQWLSEQALNPIITRLGPDPGSITLIPVGPLASLPMALAGSPRALFDIGSVGHLPNAAAYTPSTPIPPDPYVVGIADPQPTTKAALRGAVAEIEILERTYRGAYLKQPHATRDAVIRALPHADIIHVAAHAWAQLEDPLSSGFWLANDECVLLRDVLDLTITARLVVLSACESALPGQKLPDELVSLPSGLLQVGAQGVVGSLWPVDDTATALLMTQFWRLMGSSENPTESLCSAQRWLRDVTVGQLADWIREPGVPSGAADLAREVVDAYRDSAQPFRRVSSWGAFTFTGS